MSEIAILDVTKRYGDVCALEGVSLSVDAGEVVGLVGTNGAGKTTLFRLLVGHERPTAGSVEVTGLDPTDGTRVRDRVGFLPEDTGYEPALTGREVVTFHAQLRGIPSDQRSRRVASALGVVGLADAADQRVGTYSNGMGQRLGLATVLVGSPDVLLLDEPTAGLDPDGVAAFNRVVDRIRERRDVTIVLSSHDIREVERLCDRVAILDDGRIRAVGSVSELARAASDAVTVRARLEDSDEATALRERLRDEVAGVAVDDGDDTTIHVQSERNHVENLLDVVTDADADLSSIVVDEPGLERAVRGATNSRSNASGTDGGTNASGTDGGTNASGTDGKDRAAGSGERDSASETADTTPDESGGEPA